MAPSRIDRVLNVAQILTFVATVATTIPLLVSYLRNVEPAFPTLVHLHVWFGLAFMIIAAARMVARKKADIRRSDADRSVQV